LHYVIGVDNNIETIRMQFPSEIKKTLARTGGTEMLGVDLDKFVAFNPVPVSH